MSVPTSGELLRQALVRDYGEYRVLPWPARLFTLSMLIAYPALLLGMSIITGSFRVDVFMQEVLATVVLCSWPIWVSYWFGLRRDATTHAALLKLCWYYPMALPLLLLASVGAAVVLTDLQITGIQLLSMIIGRVLVGFVWFWSFGLYFKLTGSLYGAQDDEAADEGADVEPLPKVVTRTAVTRATATTATTPVPTAALRRVAQPRVDQTQPSLSRSNNAGTMLKASIAKSLLDTTAGHVGAVEEDDDEEAFDQLQTQLNRLISLHSKGLINDAELDRRRKAVLDQHFPDNGH